MSSIHVDVSEALAKLDPTKIKPAMSAAFQGAADLLLADIAKYPSPPPNSTYVRTGTLGKSWGTSVQPDIPRATVGNPTSYGPYVQDSDRQAWMHKGRWQTTRDVALRRAEDVKRLIEEALARWAR